LAVGLAVTFQAAYPGTAMGAQHVYLTGVPDYEWWRGCFGTATGNLMGYWDRHGLPGFYTGPTAQGVAPLNSFGANEGIRSMWASRAGFDGRPATQPGHDDNYWIAYESTAPDPYVTAGRTEHAPECIGDFIGLNQNKFRDLNSECDGNIDAFSFVFWDASGSRRDNFEPLDGQGQPTVDIPSGMRAWAAYRGTATDVFSQLTDFNPHTPAGAGFGFEQVKAELDAGYPFLLFLQPADELSRALDGMPQANPRIHGMLAYGYYETDDGKQYVRYRTSWASGDNILSQWGPAPWQPELVDYIVRGVIGFRPKPQIRRLTRANDGFVIEWEGPASKLFSVLDRSTTSAHWYVVEQSATLAPADFKPVSAPLDANRFELPAASTAAAFFRVRLLAPEERPR
jgi:hypothetical protein